MITDTKLQVYLPRKLADRIRERARRQGKKVAQVVRDCLELYLSRTPAQAQREAYAELDKLVGSFEGEASNASERHDEILGSDRW